MDIEGGIGEEIVRIARKAVERNDMVLKAGSIAERAHRGQQRESGQPYISHPVAVALILSEETDDPEILAAALLHDVVEDTSTTLEYIRSECGEGVARLVGGVTKLERLGKEGRGGRVHAQSVVAATCGDMRVLLVKLADRLHNIRTLSYLSAERQQRIAQETLDVYIPLARRIGMMRIADEMSEQVFAVLMPEEKSHIDAEISGRQGELREAAELLREKLSQALRREGTHDFHLQSRVKSSYSIHAKMRSTGRTLDQVHDLIAARIILPTHSECYRALGVVHGLWPPVIGRFLDHIALPKDNLYQSLHTTVMVAGETTAEIQIRTFGMHQRAEHGFASHWRYKEDEGVGHGRGAPLSEQLTELSWEGLEPAEFLNRLRAELSEDQSVIFTPDGDVLHLPSGSTALDVAYLLHSEIGDHAVGALADGAPINLGDRLPSGSSVRILVDPGREPGVPSAWVEGAVTARAKRALRQRQRRSLTSSRDWQRHLANTGLDDRQMARVLRRTAHALGLGSAAELETQVASGALDLDAAVRALDATAATAETDADSRTRGKG